LKIALGSDHAGFQLKQTIADHLSSAGTVYEDFGVFAENSVDYPDQAALVAGAVKSDRCSCGILICGTGIGMSIAANKHKGIRAALCGDTFSARYAREHNNANILTMGSRVIGSGLALAIVDTYLKSSFEGGRHNRRIEKITLAEELKR
jgi:ribose 5-phosphate isomerase B